MSFFESIKQSLREAIEIEKQNIPLVKKEGMPADTYYVVDTYNIYINNIKTEK